MDTANKVSNSSGLLPCFGIATFNAFTKNTGGFVSNPLKIPELKPQSQNRLTGGDLQGSEPSTPGSDGEEIDDVFTSTTDTALDMDTREIINTFLKDFTALSLAKVGKNQVLSTMKRVVASLVVKHEIAYTGMITRLNLEEKGDDVSFVKNVAKELFSDGITNWGRIASLLAFGALVCKYQNDRGRSQCVSLVGEEISSYLLSAQRDWLLKNKAWDGFVEFFHVPDTEAAVRNTLMAIGSVATVGAALVYWIR